MASSVSWDSMEKHWSPQPALHPTHPSPLGATLLVLWASLERDTAHRMIQPRHSRMRLQRSLQRRFGAHESEGLSTWWGGMSPRRGRTPCGTALLPEHEPCRHPRGQEQQQGRMMGPSECCLTGSAVNCWEMCKSRGRT